MCNTLISFIIHASPSAELGNRLLMGNNWAIARCNELISYKIYVSMPTELGNCLLTGNNWVTHEIVSEKKD